jgi:hypothetical protein
MHAPRKFWLVLSAAVAALVVIACSCSSIIPTPTQAPIPTQAPLPTAAPLPTFPPAPTAVPYDPMAGMEGVWVDPDTTGTTSTIVKVGDGYEVVSVTNVNRGNVNELTYTNWDGYVLTWTYCVDGGACVTTVTISVDGDGLYTSWSNDQNNSGYTTLQRVGTSGSSSSSSGEPMPGLVGKWLDPDTTGTYSVIVWQNGEYVVVETGNPNRGGNEVVSSDWDGSQLTWTYCVPNGACVTTIAYSVSGDYLYTSWSNDQGYSGDTTMNRVP